MKKLISILLALLLAFCCAVPVFAASASDAAETFVPVLRFIASSDTHVVEEGGTTFNRIGMMLDNTYALAEADPNYNRLDALVVAGDLTNGGKKEQFDNFWKAVRGALRDETEYMGIVAMNHDGYAMPHAQMRAYYSSVTGKTPDFHTVINGFHFIGISVSDNLVLHYDAGQLAWLKRQLDEAVGDTPDKPVFVIRHEPSTGTTYGSWLFSVGVPYFRAILNQYPQVFEICGHSHYPLNDPRSLWQGEYTAIGTGAMYYADFYVEHRTAFVPEDGYQTATYWVIEADASGRVRLRGMQLYTNACLCEYVLENPADPANRDYTPESGKPPQRRRFSTRTRNRR